MKRRLVQTSMFPEPVRGPKPPGPRHINCLTNDDALDGFMSEYYWAFGHKWKRTVGEAMKFLKWAERVGVSPRDIFRKAPKKTRTTPESWVMWFIGRSDVNTPENYHTWLHRHSTRRVRLKGGKPALLGDVLRAATLQQTGRQTAG